ncbi:MAG: hypothetical protein ABGW74_03585 [Campylobacterales bacterium]
MGYPDFYDNIDTIKVVDELSAVLGAFDNGEYEFNYVDVVKSAGHSCPTVAGAYLIVLEASKALYPNDRMVRGGISVEFKDALEDGVIGVISNVISQITGATDKSGFKGLNGKFVRHSLMDFNSDINSFVRFTRLDNDSSVELSYNSSSLPADPNINILMQKIMQNKASLEEYKTFSKLWQLRVKNIFDNSDKVIKITHI